MELYHLDAQIKAVYPACTGLSLGKPKDKTTLSVIPAPTGADAVAVQAVIDAFDFNAPAPPSPADLNRQAAREALAAAISAPSDPNAIKAVLEAVAKII